MRGFPVVLLACRPLSGGPPVDTDGDGLTDGAEIGLGSDPADADSDDDGLLDGEELALGTLWFDPDSDDDGYSDRDEHHAGSDPLNPDAVIYLGGWPYYYAKDELKGGKVFEVGNRFANLHLQDQFGQFVFLWDFYNDEKYVVVDICWGWTSPCDELSRWIAGERGAQFAPWLEVADAVDGRELYWITVLVEGYAQWDPATRDDAEAWTAAHPHSLVPVLADTDFESFVFTGGYYGNPTLVLLSPDLTVQEPAQPSTYAPVLDAALEILDP